MLLLHVCWCGKYKQAHTMQMFSTAGDTSALWGSCTSASAHSHGNIIKRSAAMWQPSYVFQRNGHSNVDLNKYAHPIHSNCNVWSCGRGHGVQWGTACNRGEQPGSLWVVGKPTSGDLELGRSGRREEAGRVRASRGSFPVYTGGINGKQQEKTECVHTSLRPQGL